jgi:quinol monooxygenase YgiN
MAEAAYEIAIIIEYRVAPERRAEFLACLKVNCAETWADDGCLRMEISEPIGGDGTTFLLTERWRDQAAIDRHRRKPGHDEGHARLDRLIEAKRVWKCRVIGG